MIDIEAIFAVPGRRDQARAMDGPRRTSDMIREAGLEPGQSILEIEPGKGWFTDILLRLIKTPTTYFPHFSGSKSGRACPAR